MKASIEQALKDLMQNWGHPEVAFVVDYPTDKNSGADFYSNIAMVLSKKLGKSPVESAALIANSFLLQGVTVKATGPFLNFFIDEEWYTNQLRTILADEYSWGSNNSQKDQVVLVEYTSPNLFKPLHIGNLVGNIIGESLTRLFENGGAKVKRLNYPSDIGLTVAKAVWGLKKTGGNPEDIHALGEAYRTGNDAYENNVIAKEEIVVINQALYAQSDAELMTLRDRGISTSKRQLDEICGRLGTQFDAVIYESEAAEIGVQTVKENVGRVFEESEGATVYKGEKVGLHTRVFLNSKGLPTYEAKDLGNFVLKQKQFPVWITSVIVTGNEQTEYFKVLYAAIKEVFPEVSALNQNLEHVPTGFLTLTTGKMSSRKGNVLTGESLLEEMEQAAKEKAAEARTDNIDELTEQVAVAALKYQILRQSVGSNIIFDKERALSFEGDSGPYLQYTYARIQSVLQKAHDLEILPSVEQAPDQPFEVQKLLSRFPAILEIALWERSPHKVTTYLTELAGAFNTFYAHEKIADTTDEFRNYKVAVTKAVGVTLKRGLYILGIEAPERM